jgi:Ca2+-binding EF-hand superfamily protein
LRLSFDEIDTDDDDQVTMEELDQGLSSSTRRSTMRVELWMLPQEDPIFTALDQDHDGQLDAREMASCSQRLLELDLDQDGIVQSSETDFGMFVVLRNAPPGNGFPPPSLMQSERVAPPSDRIPAWFRATDSNGDGFVSRREFLGQMTSFQQLDADNDGLLSTIETAAE